MRIGKIHNRRAREKLLIRHTLIDSIKMRDFMEYIFTPKRREVGLEREDEVEEVLKEMKRDGEILEYLRTERFSAADVLEGVDFYVIHLSRLRRIVIKLDVCGEYYIPQKLDKHKDVVPFPVRLGEPKCFIRLRIDQVLKNFSK